MSGEAASCCFWSVSIDKLDCHSLFITSHRLGAQVNQLTRKFTSLFLRTSDKCHALPGKYSIGAGLCLGERHARSASKKFRMRNLTKTRAPTVDRDCGHAKAI
jgi:hypothetical protein